MAFFFSCFTPNLRERSCSLFVLGRFGYRGLHHPSSPLTPIRHHRNGHRQRHSRLLLDTVPHQTALQPRNHHRRQLTLYTLHHQPSVVVCSSSAIYYANNATTTYCNPLQPSAHKPRTKRNHHSPYNKHFRFLAINLIPNFN